MYVWSPTDSIPQKSKQFLFTSLYSEHISSAWCSRHRFQRRILHVQSHDCRHPGNTVPLPWLDVTTRRILEETSRKSMHSCWSSSSLSKLGFRLYPRLLSSVHFHCPFTHACTLPPALIKYLRMSLFIAHFKLLSPKMEVPTLFDVWSRMKIGLACLS